MSESKLTCAVQGRSINQLTSIYIIDNKAARSSLYGIGTYINQLTISLHQSDLHVCYIHLNADIQRFSQEERNGVNHWNIPCPKLKYKNEEKNQYFYYQNIVYIIRQYIQSTGYLIFHLNYPNCKPLVDALKVSFACKIVLAVHYFSWGFDVLGNVSQLKNIVKKPDAKIDIFGKQLKKTFNDEKEMLGAVDKIICLSNYTAKLIPKLYKVEKQKICRIYNGLEDRKQQTFDNNLIRKKYNIPINAPVIIFAGRLDPIKGLSYFIKASKIVLDQFPKCHFIVAGSGDYDIWMKECQNRWMNIHFTGLLEKAELYELYQIANVGVAPSLFEPFGYVALEMMMFELPVVATATSGLNEVVNDTCGLKIPVIIQSETVEIDASLLAKKIVSLIHNPAAAKIMGQSGRKRYLEKYSSLVFGKKMKAFYKSLL